ncbi:ribose-phosphate diphosphokinase [Microvirga alba]|nr:ribose-phosphate diphosphokinase [Microvirga alba]
MTDPALRRLFERLDFAPQPKDGSLARLLTYWQDRRGGAIAPRPRDIAVPELAEDAANAFVFRFSPGGRDLALIFGGAALESLVGPCDPGAEVLTEAAGRRGVVRLRRLADLVRPRAEPVLAEFMVAWTNGNKARVEMLVAPLSTDGRIVDGLFGGLALRHIRTTTAHAGHALHAAPAKDKPLIFALKTATEFGERVARHIGVPLQSHEEREFEDGEHKTRPLIDVRDSDVHVIADLHGGGGQSANDRLCRLLFFVGALNDSGAARVSVVAPYLCYSRKDRQTKPYDPITTRYVAQLFEAVKTHRLITMEAHNLAAFQNAFRCETMHLNANSAFIDHLIETTGGKPLAIVSPDIGGAKRVETFRQDIEKHLGHPVTKAVSDKHRSLGHLSGDLFMGDVSGRVAVIMDDLISTGSTMARVAAQCRMHGASRVFVMATHGVGGNAALNNLKQPTIDKVILTNTIPQAASFLSALADRLTVLDVSEVFARAIKP